MQLELEVLVEVRQRGDQRGQVVIQSLDLVDLSRFFSLSVVLSPTCSCSRCSRGTRTVMRQLIVACFCLVLDFGKYGVDFGLPFKIDKFLQLLFRRHFLRIHELLSLLLGSAVRLYVVSIILASIVQF